MKESQAHQLEVEEEVYRRWWHLGQVNGLDTDTKIAIFLLQHFEDSRVHAKPDEYCIRCQRVLPRVCSVCSPVMTKTVGCDHNRQQNVYLHNEHHNDKCESSPSSSENCDQPKTVLKQGASSVFMQSSSVLSAKNVRNSSDDVLLFTNLFPVSKDEIQAGNFSVIDPVDKKPTMKSPVSNEKSYSECRDSNGAGYDRRRISEIEHGVSEPFPVRIFQISDIEKVAVNAVFTNYVRKVQPVPQPSVARTPSLDAKEEEHCEMDTGFDGEDGDESEERLPDANEGLTNGRSAGDVLPLRIEAGNGSADDVLTQKIEEAKGPAQKKPKLTSQPQNKIPRSTSTRKTWGRPPYLCQKCGDSFKSTSSLTRHILKHTGERPFPCSECNAAFTTRPELTVHFRKHTGEKPFLCPVCGSAYDRSSNLHTHLRTHTGERPFKCDQCNGGFTTSSSLTRHKRIHTGEKPYVCSQCGAAFPQLGHLKEHQHRHTGIKPHQCQHCTAAFSTMSRLRRHQQKVQCTKR